MEFLQPPVSIPRSSLGAITFDSRTLLVQGCTNTGRQVAVATKFFMVAADYYEVPVRNLLRVTLLAP